MMRDFLKKLFCRHTKRIVKIHITITDITITATCKNCGKKVKPFNLEKIERKCLVTQLDLIKKDSERKAQLKKMRKQQEAAERRAMEEMLRASQEALFNASQRWRQYQQYGSYQSAYRPQPSPIPEPKWCIILGVKKEQPIDQIEKQYRIKASKAHPDRGGSTEAMQELNRAIEEARKYKTIN